MLLSQHIANAIVRNFNYGLVYLRNIGVPRDGNGMMAYFSEVLQLGRRLSELEVDALRLKDRVKEAGEESIEVRIRGLE